MLVAPGEAEPDWICSSSLELGDAIGLIVENVLRIWTLDKRFSEALT
jgi:hypothetical protein